MTRMGIALVATVLVVVVACHGFADESRAGSAATPLWQTDFADTAYGNVPHGWRDLVGDRPSRNWIVDGNGLVRQTRKSQTGMLAYEGDTADGKPATALGD